LFSLSLQRTTMSYPAVLEYVQKNNIFLTLEFFYMGEKIDDPTTYFEADATIFEFFFPKSEEIFVMINDNLKFKDTHKLVISEYGFHVIRL